MENLAERKKDKPRTVKNKDDGWGPYRKPRNVHIVYQNKKRYCYYRKRGVGSIALPNLPYDHPDFLSAYIDAATQCGDMIGGNQGVMVAKKVADAEAIASSLGVAMRKAKSRAAERELAFNLTQESMQELFVAQNGKCAMTGLAFTPNHDTESRRNPFGPSIDRVDLTLGYIKGNVRIVTCIANCARSDFGDEAFYRMCAAGALKFQERRKIIG